IQSGGTLDSFLELAARAAAFAVVIALAAAFLRRLLRPAYVSRALRGEPPRTRSRPRTLDELVEHGRFDIAGQVALEQGLREQAIEYFERGQEIQRAVDLALEMGNTKQAAGIY